MSGNVPIPQADVVYLPGAVWVLMGLAVVTFWLHQLSVGAALGSVVFVLAGRLVRWGRSEAGRAVRLLLLFMLPLLVSLMIVLGLATLLFTQVLYGPYFYSATIFTGWYWMGVPVLLLLVFVGGYFARSLGEHLLSWGVLVIVCGCTLVIGYIMTNNTILAFEPEHWLRFHREPWRFSVPSAIMLPRLLGNLAMVFTVSGAVIAWLGRGGRAQGESGSAEIVLKNATSGVRVGLGWLAAGVVMQVGFGLWYAAVLPAEVREGLWGFGNVLSAGWYGGWLFLLGALAAAGKGIFAAQKKRWLILSTVGVLLGLLGMSAARELVRVSYLGRSAAGGYCLPESWDVGQRGPLVLFGVVAGVCLVVLAGMLWLVLRNLGRAAQAARVTPSGDVPNEITEGDKNDVHE